MTTFALRSFTLPALVALCSCGGSGGERVHQDVHQNIAAGPAPVVHVDNITGSVRISVWSKPTVDVNATKYAFDAEQLQSITISVHEEGNRIFIVTTHSPGVRGGVRYQIAVPANSSLQVGNVAGVVDVAGVRGDVIVATQAGSIAADLGRVEGNRSIDLRATTGTVTLSIAPDSSAQVEAQSTVGGFSSDVPGIAQNRENLVGARANGTIGSGSARIRLSTTTGAIALREGSRGTAP